MGIRYHPGYDSDYYDEYDSSDDEDDSESDDSDIGMGYGLARLNSYALEQR